MEAVKCISSSQSVDPKQNFTAIKDRCVVFRKTAISEVECRPSKTRNAFKGLSNLKPNKYYTKLSEYPSKNYHSFINKRKKAFWLKNSAEKSNLRPGLMRKSSRERLQKFASFLNMPYHTHICLLPKIQPLQCHWAPPNCRMWSGVPRFFILQMWSRKA